MSTDRLTTDRQARIREFLRAQPDGASPTRIALFVGVRSASDVRRAVLNMPDVYIDRWETIHRTRPRNPKRNYIEIYCAVPVPENCPHP